MNFQKIPLLLVVLTLCWIPGVKASSDKAVKSAYVFWDNTDDAAVLQSCFDLPQMQKYYPKNADGSYKQVYVMQFPVAFDPSLAVSKFDQSILFEPRESIYSDKAEGFFIVKEFTVNGTSAKVNFQYFYNYTTIALFTDISLTLQKSGSIWSVLTTTINS